ncbi:Biotrophy-associated secreted protein 2 [Pyricularia oryzae]
MVRVSTFAAILAMALSVTANVTPNDAGAKNVGTGNGQQFITGGCVNGPDCQSRCCAGNGENKGVCSNEVAANQNGKTGCGFEDPNKAQTVKEAKEQVKKQGF